MTFLTALRRLEPSDLGGWKEPCANIYRLEEVRGAGRHKLRPGGEAKLRRHNPKPVRVYPLYYS